MRLLGTGEKLRIPWYCQMCSTNFGELCQNSDLSVSSAPRTAAGQPGQICGSRDGAAQVDAVTRVLPQGKPSGENLQGVTNFTATTTSRQNNFVAVTVLGVSTILFHSEAFQVVWNILEVMCFTFREMLTAAVCWQFLPSTHTTSIKGKKKQDIYLSKLQRGSVLFMSVFPRFDICF